VSAERRAKLEALGAETTLVLVVGWIETGTALELLLLRLRQKRHFGLIARCGIFFFIVFTTKLLNFRDDFRLVGVRITK
jgi:hypothetical protein